MTLKSSRNKLYLANTKIADLEHIKNTQPISATHTNRIVQQFTHITLVTDEYLKSIQENPIQHFDQSLRSFFLQSQNSLKISQIIHFVSRFLILKNSFFAYIQRYGLLSNLNKLLNAFKTDWSKHLKTGAYSVKAFKAQSKKTVFLLWF